MTAMPDAHPIMTSSGPAHPNVRLGGRADDAGLTLPAVIALWLIPVLLTVASASDLAILVSTSMAAVVCTISCVMRPAGSLVVLPFFALLSPMTGLLDLGGAKLVLSDIFFALLAVQAAQIALLRTADRRPPLPLALSALGLLFLLSVVVGSAAGYLVSYKPAAYLIQLVIICALTAAHATTAASWRAVMWAWIAASTLGALILLAAYLDGRNLDSLKDPELAVVSAEDLLSLFRATYYYSGFHYLLGLCVVFVATRLLFPATWLVRAGLSLVLTLLSLALLAMVNKTAIASVVIAILATTVLLFVRFRAAMARSMLWLGVLVAGGLAVLSWQYYEIAESTQIDLILDRLFNLSSLLARLEVYVQAIQVWASSAVTVLIGYGPDFLDSSGDALYSTALKTAQESGYVEGTLDSAWLSYLIEFGLPGLACLAWLFILGVQRVSAGLRRCARFDDIAWTHASLFGGLVFLVLAMTTQMLGYSKTAWLPVQVLVVAVIGLSGRSVARG